MNAKQMLMTALTIAIVVGIIGNVAPLNKALLTPRIG